MEHLDPDEIVLLALDERGTHDDREQPASQTGVDERSRDHLRECAVCRTEFAQLARTVELARSVGEVGLQPPVVLPASIWNGIAAELGIGAAGIPLTGDAPLAADGAARSDPSAAVPAVGSAGAAGLPGADAGLPGAAAGPADAVSPGTGLAGAGSARAGLAGAGPAGEGAGAGSAFAGAPGASGAGDGQPTDELARHRAGRARAVSSVQSGRSARRSWRRGLLVAAVVVAAGAGTAAGLAIGSHQSPASGAVQYQADLRPMPAGPPDAHATATIVASGAAQTLDVDAHQLPLRQGYYEVWLYNPTANKMVAVGTLGAAGNGIFTLASTIDLRSYSVVDVSAQDFDGNPVHKTSVLQGPLTQ